MYFYLKNIQGVKKHGMFNKWCCEINQLISKTKRKTMSKYNNKNVNI
ncbi:hypothetical protein BCM0045_2379 [Bacillus cereus]|nr:hypothetical protein BCM0045_2379 [Bacillus cereus]